MSAPEACQELPSMQLLEVNRNTFTHVFIFLRTYVMSMCFAERSLFFVFTTPFSKFKSELSPVSGMIEDRTGDIWSSTVTKNYCVQRSESDSAKKRMWPSIPRRDAHVHTAETKPEECAVYWQRSEPCAFLSVRIETITSFQHLKSTVSRKSSLKLD